MLTNIIVIGFRLGKLERDCLVSVHANTSSDYILTYYDNYKNLYTLTELWNSFIEQSKTDYICLLNNDTVVTPGWLDELLEVFKEKPDCGFVGPSTNNCHSPQKTVSFEQALKLPKTVIEMKDPISGFCVLFKKETWTKLGGFDIRFKHYGQESDFIDRAKTQLGLKSYWRQDTFVHHVGEASVKSSGMNVKAAREEAKKLYWSSRK